MAIERRLGCELVGLSTDSKPDYPGLFDHRFYEIDTGNIYYYGGAAWAAVVGSAASQTITNKTISNNDNDFDRQSAVDLPGSYGYHRSGSLIPGVNGPYLCGPFGGMNVSVGAGESAYSTLDAVEGNYQNFKGSLTGEKLGIQSTSSTNSLITTRGQSPDVAVRCRVDVISGIRFWFGFTSLQTLPASNTVLGSADSGVIIGFGSATNNYTIYYNDGLQAAATIDTGTAKDINWHTFEIAMTPTTVTCIIDGTATLLSSQITATTTPLYFNCVVQYV